MKQEQFLALVRDRGEYADLAEAERVTRAVLAVLACRIGAEEAKDLAAQLPGLLAEAVPDQVRTEVFGRAEFLGRVAALLDASEETAVWDASAVLTTLAEAVSGGQLNQLLSRLPSGYAELFGKPELS